MTRSRVVVVAAVSVVLMSVVAAVPAAAADPGTPYTWGANTYGQLGDGTTSPHLAAMPVNGITGAIDVAAGREHALALMPDGTVRTWGHNNFGQIGDGSISNRLSPVTGTGPVRRDRRGCRSLSFPRAPF